jgi:hypothetical protein
MKRILTLLLLLPLFSKAQTDLLTRGGAVVTTGYGLATQGTKLVVDTTKFKSAPTAVSTRAAMAALAGMVNGQVITLTEPGREGLWKFAATGQDSNIVYDPLQGLFVGTGAGGAWVRQVQNSTYTPEWFGLTRQTYAADVIYRRMLRLIPPNSTVIIPPFKQIFTDVVVIDTPGTHLIGTPGSHITYDSTADNYPLASGAWSTRTMLVIRKSNCSVEGFSMRSAYHVAASGGAFSLAVYPKSGEAEIRNCMIRNMRFTGSEGIIAISEAADSIDVPMADLWIENCVFDSVDYQAVSVFGAERFRITGCIVNAAQPKYPRFTPMFRILGTKDGFIENNYINANQPGPAFGGERGMFGIAMMAMSAGGAIGRRVNTNVTVRSNIIRNCHTPIYAQEVSGRLLVDGNTFENSLTDTVPNTAIYMTATPTGYGGPQPKLEYVDVTNNTSIGHQQFFHIEGAAGTVRVDGNSWFGNAAKPSALSGGRGHYAVRADNFSTTFFINRLEVTNNRFNCNDSFLTGYVTLLGTQPNTSYFIADNWMPRRVATGPGPFIVANGSGYIFTSQLDKGTIASASVIPNGSNRSFGDTTVASSTNFALRDAANTYTSTATYTGGTGATAASFTIGTGGVRHELTIKNERSDEPLITLTGFTSGESHNRVGIGTYTPYSRLSFGNDLADPGNRPEHRLALYETSDGTGFYGLGVIKNATPLFGIGLWAGTGGTRPYDGNTGIGAPFTFFSDGHMGINHPAPRFHLDVDGIIASGTETGSSGEFRSYQPGSGGAYTGLITDPGAFKAGLKRSNTNFFVYYSTATGNTHLDATFAGSSLMFDVQGSNRASIGGDGLKLNNQSEPATPTGGGIIYVEGGALKYKGSSGTVTTIANP